MIVGTTYLLRGRPVRVLARWLDARDEDGRRIGMAVRNVLVEDEDGRRFVRPFRGLRHRVCRVEVEA